MPTLPQKTCNALVLSGGRILDPAAGRDEVGDLYILDGRISTAAPRDADIIDCTGWIVCPGLCDMHVHLREPGHEHKETIATGTAAAAAGGFTAVACMPNTRPAIDTPETVRFVLRRAEESGACAVLPIAAITHARAGQQVTDFAALRDSGAVAFSDDGDGVENDEVMLRAFQQAQKTGTLLIQHCEYKRLSAGGVMHLGEVSRRIGLPGLDPRSEEAMIERDIDLCRRTGGRYHVAHISTARAIDLVRRAKSEGLPVTAEVCTHHLVLTHEACAGANPDTKMHPPLRTQEDVEACRQGLRDGTIDCIVTDHAPHAPEEKALGFLQAPPGIIGLETSLGLAVAAMIDAGLADWAQLVRWMSAAPKALLNRSGFGIAPGQSADVTMIDPASRWRVDPEILYSKSRNTPFAGWNVTGRAVGTIRGRTVTSELAARIRP